MTSHEGMKVRPCMATSVRSSNLNYTLKAVKYVKHIKDKQKRGGREHEKGLRMHTIVNIITKMTNY
jgi:hypothetical protein